MRTDGHRLQDIKLAIDDLRVFVADLDEPTFLATPKADRKTFRAVCSCLQDIGEAVKAVSQEVRDRHPHIPWRLIAGMRDHIVHEYFRTDPGIIWATLKSGELTALYRVVVLELEREGEWRGKS